MTDTSPAPLPPGTAITVANLAQALAELMLKLPRCHDDVRPGELYVNGGTLTRSLEEEGA